MTPTILTFVLLALVAGFFVWRTRHNPGAVADGFRDWVRSPTLRRSANDYFEKQRAVTVSDDISPQDIQALVDRIFVQQDNDFTMERLKRIGAKATPSVIDALKSERVWSMTFSGGHALDPKSPFERICRLLRESGPPEAAGALIRFAAHDDAHFRKFAAITLATIGTAECSEPVSRLLNDEHDTVRSFAVMGVESGLNAGRCTAEFLDGVIRPLESLLACDSRSCRGKGPKLLLKINRDRAVALMLSDRYFTASNRQLQFIIEASNEKPIPIPHDKLLPLLNALEPLIGSRPHDCQYAAALIAYAHHPDGNAETTLTQALESPVLKVQTSAAKSLEILSDIRNPSEHVLALLKEQGWDSLSKPQQYYHAVRNYDAEVRNGGHAQYFVNSSGDHYGAALSGLTAIEAIGLRPLLSRAIELFGPNGPSADNERRHAQLAAFKQAQNQQLSSLDSEYFAARKPLAVLLSTYVRKNKDQFSTVD